MCIRDRCLVVVGKGIRGHVENAHDQDVTGTGNPDVTGLQVCGVGFIHGEPKFEPPVKNRGQGSLTMNDGDVYDR